MALQGRICIVTGASRGIGKGIAVQLGEAGATVYITGRTLKPTEGKSGSLEETAAEVTRRGGQGIAVQCDHKNQDDVTKLFERVNTEQDGRLDLLVNNAFSAGKALIPCMDKKFYEIPGDIWDEVNDVALRNCYYCAWHAAKMMVPRKQGLIISISSLVAVMYMVNVAIGVGKAASDRMVSDMAIELKDTGVSCLTLWPGTVMTENMVDMLNGDDDFSFMKELKIAAQYAETPEFTGIAVVSLLKDKNLQKKSGRVHAVAELGEHYGFKDIDGQRPLSFRSFKNLLLMTGHPVLACFFPRWVKIPKWVFTLLGGKF